MLVDCICNYQEVIDEFYSIWEFERFRKYISNLVDNNELHQIPVLEPFAGFPEKWYQCVNCSKTWRLVYPDFPFKGYWNEINKKIKEQPKLLLLQTLGEL